jgi:SAM-dependent methyltransferase
MLRASRHLTGDGLWGVMINGTDPPQPSPEDPHGRGWQLTGLRGASRAENRCAVEANPHYRKALGPPTPTARGRRHERIERAVVREIASEIRRLALSDCRLLQIQAGYGQQTLLFSDQLVRPQRPVIYDLQDGRDPEARAGTDFATVDCDAAAFPAPDNHFDVVVWNRDLVTVKSAGQALREARRVLRPGGVMIVAVPNLAALHNRLLLLAGFQPTTLHIYHGDHVRGFASLSMTRVLERDLGFSVKRIVGVGLAPVSSAAQPRWLRALSHTVIWVMRKPGDVSRTRSRIHRRLPRPRRRRRINGGLPGGLSSGR